MFCRERAARFSELRHEIEGHGASVVAIGNGTVHMANDFLEQFSIEIPVFTDPSRATYRLAGLKRSFGLGLKSIGRGRRAMSQGHRQGATRGDPWQQGGLLLVGTKGEVLFRHVDDGAGDEEDTSLLMAALSAL